MKSELYWRVAKHNGFLANVIQVRYAAPARKLKGALELIDNGHELRIGGHDIDALLVDGERFDWEALENDPLSLVRPVDDGGGHRERGPAICYWSHTLGKFISPPEKAKTAIRWAIRNDKRTRAHKTYWNETFRRMITIPEDQDLPELEMI